MAECWLCHDYIWDDPLDSHHCFGGASRKLSTKYGAVVKLHHNKCHIFGHDAVHQNRENDLKVKRWAQRKIMTEQGWTVNDFIAVFGKNYI